MTEGTDELFSDPPSGSRIRWIRRLLWVGVPLDLNLAAAESLVVLCRGWD